MSIVRVQNKIGFILSYPTPISVDSIEPVNQKIAPLFNDLLVRLNRKYPELFPYCHYSEYRVILAYNSTKVDFASICEENNLARINEKINDLDTVICFGEKAYFAIQKTLELYPRTLNVIKTKSITYPVSRHIKVNAQEPPKRFRTNYNVITQFNEIDRQLSQFV